MKNQMKYAILSISIVSALTAVNSQETIRAQHESQPIVQQASVSTALDIRTSLLGNTSQLILPSVGTKVNLPELNIHNLYLRRVDEVFPSFPRYERRPAQLLVIGSNSQPIDDAIDWHDQISSSDIVVVFHPRSQQLYKYQVPNSEWRLVDREDVGSNCIRYRNGRQLSFYDGYWGAASMMGLILRVPIRQEDRIPITRTTWEYNEETDDWNERTVPGTAHYRLKELQKVQ